MQVPRNFYEKRLVWFTTSSRNIIEYIDRDEIINYNTNHQKDDEEYNEIELNKENKNYKSNYILHFNIK